MFAVTLLLHSSHVTSDTTKEPVVGFANHRGIPLAFGPYVIFSVSTCNDTALDPVGVAVFVCFDCLNAHGGDNRNMGELVEVVGFVDDFVGVLVGQTIVFFAVGFLPEYMIRV